MSHSSTPKRGFTFVFSFRRVVARTRRCENPYGARTGWSCLAHSVGRCCPSFVRPNHRGRADPQSNQGPARLLRVVPARRIERALRRDLTHPGLHRSQHGPRAGRARPGCRAGLCVRAVQDERGRLPRARPDLRRAAQGAHAPEDQVGRERRRDQRAGHLHGRLPAHDR
jgi:hypothetical protein